MASVFKRRSDRARGKLGKYTCSWTGADSKRHTCVGVTDKAESLRIAQHREAEARRVREGMADPHDRARHAASLLPIAKHVEDYRLSIIARGGTTAHARHTAGALRRILADASIGSIADIAPDRLQDALGRLKVKRSARTCNDALKAVRAFARWLVNSNRLREVPRGLAAIPTYNEGTDRRRVRRALTGEELERLLAAAAAGDPVKAWRGPPALWLSGPDRATLYRLAMGTGFRANELRSLTPESFHLDGPNPSVTVLAAYAKNRVTTVQPIRRELAERLRPLVAGAPPGKPVLPVPEKTAEMIQRDLEAAGIAYKDERGRVCDFHALRASYITHLVMSGVNPKVVQRLARHSTITLTMDRYVSLEDSDVRKALENQGKGEKDD